MKRAPLIIALAAGMLAQSAFAQSSTPVIGYYRLTVPAGKSLLTSAFITKTDFQAAATTVAAAGANTLITQTGAAWANNQFQTSANPATNSSHYVEILSGPNAGSVCDIISNTGSSVTIEGAWGTSPFTYAIRKHATLGGIFKSSGLAEFEDEILLFDDLGVARTYQYDGTPGSEQIVDAPTQSVNSDNVVVYPGQGFVITAVTGKTLTFGGNEVAYVKNTPTNVPLYRNQTNLVGLLNPLVNETPLVSGAPAATEAPTIGSIGLQASGLAEYEDEIRVFGVVGGALTLTGTYYVDLATNDVVLGDGTVVSNSVRVPNGTAILVRPAGANRIFKLPVLHPTN